MKNSDKYSSMSKFIITNREFSIGLFVMLMLYFPVLYFNIDMKLIIHDTFDLDLVNLVLQAKHIGESYLPEFLGGTSKIAAHSSAPGLQLFFILFPAKYGFFIIYMFITIFSYIGMFLCVTQLLGKKWIAAVTGVLYTILPFYPLFGFTVMGQPWVIYAFINLWKQRHIKFSYLIIAIFSLFSSLALVGYADIFLLFFILVIGLTKGKHMKEFVLGLFIMIGCFLLVDGGLLLSIFSGKSEYLSHRTEWTWTVRNSGVENFRDILNKIIDHPRSYIFSGTKNVFWGMLSYCHYHAASNHTKIMQMTFAVFLVVSLCYHTMQTSTRKKYYGMLIALFLVIAIAAFYALWWASACVLDIRSLLGGIFVYFQADRFYFLYPCLWFLLLAYSLFFVDWFLNEQKHGKSRFIILIVLIVYLSHNLLFKVPNTLIENYRCFKNMSYISPMCESIDEFFQPELFLAVKEKINQPQNQYKVCSIGLHPSVALFNGFYCLDAYSTSYDINYKHAFRSIIEKELDKNEAMKGFFDSWGSRCYVFVSEIFGDYYYMFGKGRVGYVNYNEKIKLENTSLNYNVMKKMGCQYIFSSVEIVNAPEIELMQYYSHLTGHYDVYLYKIK